MTRRRPRQPPLTLADRHVIPNGLAVVLGLVFVVALVAWLA